MNKVVFLCEEPSMKEFLDGFLPRFIPGLDFICVKHEGKQDLQKSIPRKLRAWNDPDVAFVVLQDNDGGSCKRLKRRLVKICEGAGRPEALVRIVCQTLEAWYLGVPVALGEAYALPEIAKIGRKAKFRDPDHLGDPSSEIETLIPEFRKVDGARRMAEQMPVDPAKSASRSFQVFAEGVRGIAGIAARRR